MKLHAFSEEFQELITIEYLNLGDPVRIVLFCFSDHR